MIVVYVALKATIYARMPQKVIPKTTQLQYASLNYLHRTVSGFASSSKEKSLILMV
jgi:hypothetical protein